MGVSGIPAATSRYHNHFCSIFTPGFLDLRDYMNHHNTLFLHTYLDTSTSSRWTQYSQQNRCFPVIEPARPQILHMASTRYNVFTEIHTNNTCDHSHTLTVQAHSIIHPIRWHRLHTLTHGFTSSHQWTRPLHSSRVNNTCYHIDSLARPRSNDIAI